MAKMAMLTITADDGAQGFFVCASGSRAPVRGECFFRKVLVGQDPFNRERIWQDLNHWQRGGSSANGARAVVC